MKDGSAAEVPVPPQQVGTAAGATDKTTIDVEAKNRS
jgi:hypothetical protein